MTQKPGYISSPENETNQTAEPVNQRDPGYASSSDTLQAQTAEPAYNLERDAAEIPPEALSTQLGQDSGSIGKSAIAVVGVLLLLMLTNELISLWQSHWLLGALGGGVLAVVALGVVKVWRQEQRSVREIKQLKTEQEEVQQALRNNDLTALKAALSSWLDRQSKAAPQLIQRFKDAAVERTTAEEYWQLYQLMVLRELDQQAQKIIRHYTLTTGTAVMVIPHAGLDTLVVLWRSRTMTREIAAVYGLETTSLSAIRLFKQALITVMVVAGVETLAQEKLLSEGSDELMNRILGGVSQSLITARRTYKLGRMIQLACRPYGD